MINKFNFNLGKVFPRLIIGYGVEANGDKFFLKKSLSLPPSSIRMVIIESDRCVSPRYIFTLLHYI